LEIRWKNSRNTPNTRFPNESNALSSNKILSLSPSSGNKSQKLLSTHRSRYDCASDFYPPTSASPLFLQNCHTQKYEKKYLNLPSRFPTRKHKQRRRRRRQERKTGADVGCEGGCFTVLEGGEEPFGEAVAWATKVDGVAAD
jgi:hypothetical protein